MLKKKKKATSREYIWSFSPSALPHLGSYRSQWYASSQLSVLGSCTCFLFYSFSFTSLLLPTHLPPPPYTHAQSCNPMDCSLPGSSVHGLFKARILEWVAISFSTNLIFLTWKMGNSVWKRSYITHFFIHVFIPSTVIGVLPYARHRRYEDY